MRGWKLLAWHALPVLLALCPWSVRAHELSVAHVALQVRPDTTTVTVEVDVALRDIALGLPLDADGDERVTWGELLAVRDELEQMVMSGLSIESAAGACSLVPLGLATRRYDDGGYAALTLAAECPSADVAMVDYRLLFAQDPRHRALVTVQQGSQASTRIARAGAGRLVFSVAPSNPFAEFLAEGIRHILIGYDHLAFLLCLLLPAAMVRRGEKWQAVPGFRQGALHTLGLVTAFTLAHSVTLSLAALQWVTPASRWVEAAIALSVLLAALNNLHPMVSRRLWLVAFGFGLVHGFGFAGALGELGLPRNDRLLALLGFNVGVEVGQLAVVLVAFPAIYLLRDKRWYPRAVMAPASMAIAALALYWLATRLR